MRDEAIQLTMFFHPSSLIPHPCFCRTYTSNACQAMLAKAGFEVERKDCFRVGRIWGMMRFVCRKLA